MAGEDDTDVIDDVETDEQQQAGDRDYEAEARAMGWRPQSEFKGAEGQFVDAKTFIERGEQFMPILKAQNKGLVSRVKQLERGLKEATEFFTKAESRAYERAVADLKAQQRAAVETGDVAAFEAVDAKIDALNKDAAGKIGPTGDNAPDADEMVEALIDWRAENPWYGDDKLMTDYADLQARKMGARETLGMDGPEYLAAIAERVKERFPAKFEKKPEASKRRAAATEGVTPSGGSKGGRTFNDLPPDARAQCDRFVKMGVLPDRDAYVKSYQW